MKNLNQTLMITTLLTTVTATAADWNGANNPANFDSNYEYRLNALETKAYLPAENTPWPETYWPAYMGSINYRWNAKNPIGFDYASPTREQVMKMSREELAALSPAEKYDIAMGRYDYPLKNEVAAGASKSAKEWAGICNGWSAAALQFPEPQPNDVVNADGVVVPFGSSDVKGLLSYYLAFSVDLDVSQVGKRCYKISRIFGLGACEDINPGAMHVILTNQIGKKSEGFVAEVDAGHEVWNQPAYGYEYEVLGSAHSRRGQTAVHVKMKMVYTDELENSSWTPVVGTEKFTFDIREMEYTLELDQDGKIVGGEWITKNHPDFFWKANKSAKFTGFFAGLSQIYKSAR